MARARLTDEDAVYHSCSVLVFNVVPLSLKGVFKKVQYSCGFEGCHEADLAGKICKMVFRAYFSKMKNGIDAGENTPIYILQSGIPDFVYYAVRYTSRVYYVVQYIFIYINTGIPDSRVYPF